ncbi:DUF1449 family protein [Bacteroides sp. OttesenSCG-928-D19]|nr:DUF1449 family protein [Bacteroides sp. OttesenSCG-928-D19]
MSDFLYNLMHPLPNAVMTVIMGVLVLYWLFALLSGAGMDDLDLGLNFDVDTDADIDVDTDVDTDADADTDADEPGFFVKFFNFLNIGRVPFMLVLTTLKFFTWIGTLITTKFIEVTTWGAWSLLILLPLFFIAIFFTRWTTNPLVKLFKEIGYRGEEEIDFLGRTGKMLSTIQGDKIGCAEVVVEKNPIKLNVRSIDGSPIKYGEYVIIADETDDQKVVYLVNKEISIRNI